MGVKVRITGQDKLFRQLRNLDALRKQQVLRNAAIAGILPVNNKIVTELPKVTGTLARSEHIEIIEENVNYAEAATGTDVIYAARVEFGFMDVDSLGRNYNQQPNPVRRNALVSEKNKAVDEVGKALAIQLRFLLD